MSDHKCVSQRLYLFLLCFFSFRLETLQGQQDGKRGTKRRREVEEKTKCISIIEKREHKSMEGSADRAEKDKKSLVSLVSSTRLKGQMESQWGSLSGSHYWNRKFFFFFLFTYTQSQSWKQLALRDSSVFFFFLPNQWNMSVCLHSRSRRHTSADVTPADRGRWLKCGGGMCVRVCVGVTVAWMVLFWHGKKQLLPAGGWC